MQVAHDLKSPLTCIDVAYDYIDSDKHSAKSILKLSMERLNEIVYTLTPGHNTLQEFDLKTSLLKIINEKRYKVHHELISFQVNAKRIDIERMISNLLDNAFESTSNCNIFLTMNVNDNSVQLVIKDNGPGIPDSVLQNIGKIGNTYGKINGSGLGLSFMDFVMDEHGFKYQINASKNGTEIILVFS